MQLKIGKWFEIGMSIGRHPRRKTGWRWGVEFQFLRWIFSCSYCSWIRNYSNKWKPIIAPLSVPIPLYSWRKFTFILGRVKKQ